MRTVLVHLGGIGDFILTCPVIEQLAAEGQVELVGNRARLEVAVKAGLAMAAHDLEKIEFDSVFSRPSQTLKRFLAPFDRAVLWMRDDGALRKTLQTCGLPQVFAFPGRPPENWNRHASHYYFECLNRIFVRGICARRVDVARRSTNKDSARGFELRVTRYRNGPGQPKLAINPSEPRRDVIIHPGSGGRHKNWPLDRFVSVAKALQADGHAITWSAGPAEEKGSLPEIGDCLQEESLVAVAQTLAGARLYLGNDSGITHLAAAVGCPTIAIFGPTDPKIWAPQGEHVTVAQGNPWPSIDEVLSLSYTRLNPLQPTD